MIVLNNSTHFRTTLPVSYNEFIGNETNFGNNMPNLELIQLHGNRLSGEIRSFNWENDDSSSFVSDCGRPSAFDEGLTCDGCTMCCECSLIFGNLFYSYPFHLT